MIDKINKLLKKLKNEIIYFYDFLLFKEEEITLFNDKLNKLCLMYPGFKFKLIDDFLFLVWEDKELKINIKNNTGEFRYINEHNIVIKLINLDLNYVYDWSKIYYRFILGEKK